MDVKLVSGVEFHRIRVCEGLIVRGADDYASFFEVDFMHKWLYLPLLKRKFSKNMAAKYTSKHGVVSKRPDELYMGFVDMRNFQKMIPDGGKVNIRADYDTLNANVENFNIGVKVTGRVPYSLIQLQDNGAPFHFGISAHFDDGPEPGKTDFWLDVDADLNLMMKMMLGSKVQEGLDKVVDALVAASEGRMPEGVDPSIFNKV